MRLIVSRAAFAVIFSRSPSKNGDGWDRQAFCPKDAAQQLVMSSVDQYRLCAKLIAVVVAVAVAEAVADKTAVAHSTPT